jgi:hypothetical protein
MTEPVIHIGYHKTGTTWLQRKLFASAELGYRRIRFTQDDVDLYRVHDFDFDAARCRAEMERKLERCDREGLVPVISMMRLSGNPHAGGYDSRVLADRIAAVFPGARIIVVIREQRSMILSTYAQYVKMGGPCSLRGYLLTPDDSRRPGFRFEQFRYDRLIAHYQRLFGKERVLVDAYERFRSEPQAFAERVAAFCGGKAPPPGADGSVLNRSLGPLALSLLRWLNPFVNADSLNGWSPYAIPWLNKPARLLVEGVDRVTPSRVTDGIQRRWREAIAAECRGRYEESNRRSAALTGLDLPGLGYLTEAPAREA